MQPNGTINGLEFVYTAKMEGYTNLGSSMNELAEIRGIAFGKIIKNGSINSLL